MIADRRTFYPDPVEPVEEDGRALSYSKLNHVNVSVFLFVYFDFQNI